jgi:peptidoglycan lytic transglycosylase
LNRLATVIAASALIAGCQPFPDDPSRPAPGSRIPHPAQDPGQIPADEPPSRGGNPSSYVVHGQRYYVMDSSVGYVERGIASWYGPGFHGRLTSNGERYDMNGLSAAHKSLQLPTWVRVTNLSNGRSVVVRVNDRGPFVDDRIIDLSRGAAEAIDMIGTGTALVEVVALTGMERNAAARPSSGPVLDAPTVSAPAPVSHPSVHAAPGPAAAPAEQTAQPLGHEPQLWLQVGAFGDQTNAQLLADRLRGAGIDLVRIDRLQRGGSTLHRVRIGPIPGVPQFDAISELLREHDLGEAQLVIE